MANELAHAINNPLQSLTNIIYAAAVNGDNDARKFASGATPDLERLSMLVKKISLYRSTAPSSHLNCRCATATEHRHAC